MEELEIIQGIKLRVRNRNEIRCTQAARLLGRTRQRMFQLMAEYEATGGKKGLKSRRVVGVLVTSYDILKKFYEEIILVRQDTDKRYK